MTYGNEDLFVVKRITVTLDDETHEVLQQWARDDERTVPNLIAFLAKQAVKERHAATQQSK